ncbi:MAG: hypothetical protein VW437_03530 [Betaproteobacteria bacterium]
MGLFRTSLLVVLSCAVVSVQAANFNKPKTKAPPQEIKRDTSLVFWDFRPNVKICSRQTTNVTRVRPEDYDSTVYGYKWPERSIGAPKFFRDNSLIINTILSKQEGSREANDLLDILLERMLIAAKRKAFTNPDWEGPGGPSPSFMQTVVVRNVALAVSLLRQRLKLDTNSPEFRELDGWVYQLMGTMEKRQPAQDHKASAYVSQMGWGLASSNRELFEEGRLRFTKLLSKPVRDLEIGDALRHNNEVMHTALFGAYLLKINGQAGYELPVGDKTFDEALDSHVQKLLVTRDEKLKHSVDPTEPARSIFRRQGFGTHLAWIPIYLNSPGSAQTQESVKALHKALSMADGKEYFGTYIGLHSGCLFGFD